MTLDMLPVGATAQIDSVEGQGESLTQLMEMGLVSGVPVRMERTSPFGCPMAIRLKGSSIAIRRADAAQVGIKPL